MAPDQPRAANFFDAVGAPNLIKVGLPDGAKFRLLIVPAVIVILVLVGSWRSRPQTLNESAIPVVSSPSAVTAEPEVLTPTTEDAVDLVVHVAGAVVEPQVVSLDTGSRVGDAVDAAGGPTPDADLHNLNLAQLLEDGMSIVVPTIGEEMTEPAIRQPAGGGNLSGAGSTSPININFASLEELQMLVGVGPATASAIIEWRDTNGAFSSVDELLDVPGIGPAKLEAIRDDVVV